MNGYATPATGALDYEQREAIERASFDREQQKAHLIELGASTLGYHQLPIRQNGEVIAYAWQQSQAEAVAGLPPAIVDSARAALQTEAQARDTLLAKHQEARQYIAQHQLSDQAARTYGELHSAEVASAHRAAVALTPRALYALGELVEQAQQIHAVINAAPAKRAQIEASYQTALAQIDAELQSARLRAAQLGIS